jgi:hypothetical protein
MFSSKHTPLIRSNEGSRERYPSSGLLPRQGEKVPKADEGAFV